MIGNLVLVLGEEVRVEGGVGTDGEVVAQFGDDQGHLAGLEVEEGGFVGDLAEVGGHGGGEAVDFEFGTPDV